MRVSYEKNYKFSVDQHIFSDVSARNKMINIVTTKARKKAIILGEGKLYSKKRKNAKKC